MKTKEEVRERIFELEGKQDDLNRGMVETDSPSRQDHIMDMLFMVGGEIAALKWVLSEE